MTREDSRGRGAGVGGEAEGGTGCGIWGRGRFWAAASSQAARAEGSTGQEVGGRASVSEAMARWGLV